MLKLPSLTINFNQQKNLIIKATRNISFEDCLEAINKNQILANFKHPDPGKYPNQKILIIKIKNYAYAVPYIINKSKKEIFLKTIYPSRAMTRKYIIKLKIQK